MRKPGLARHPARNFLRDDGALEDSGRQVDRDTRVRYVDDTADPTLYRSRPDYDVGLLVRVATRLEVLDGVQTGVPVSDSEVYVSGHLYGPAEGDLAVTLREVQVPHRELGAVDVHREVDPRADREIFDVDVTAMLARRNRPAGLPGSPLELTTAQRPQQRVLLERGKGQRRHPIGVRVDEGLLPAVPPGKQIVGRSAADEPRVPYPHELHVWYVARGGVQTTKVPDRLVGLRVDVG